MEIKNTRPKRGRFNIGILIFGIIFIYIAVTVFFYLTKHHVIPYEVRTGSILQESTYEGIAVREETVVNFESSGYVHYYLPSGSKAAVGTDVYIISGRKINFPEFTTLEQRLSQEIQTEITHTTQTFIEGFDAMQFESSYLFQESITSILQRTTRTTLAIQIKEMLENGTLTDVSVYPAADDGIIAYSIDGFEGKSVSDITLADFDKRNYSPIESENEANISVGNPAYKLITSENWSIIIHLEDEMAETLAERTSVQINIKKDNRTMEVPIEIIEKDGESYGILSFTHSAVRYITERFLEIDIIVNNNEGLRIPKSAVTQKEVFVIPEEYLTLGEGGSGNGLLFYSAAEASGGAVKNKNITVYVREEGLVYFTSDEFQIGDSILKNDSSETYILREIVSLEGVYNINRGYAIFRRIQKLAESDNYYLIVPDTSYGISNYDYIALEGNLLIEDTIVF